MGDVTRKYYLNGEEVPHDKLGTLKKAQMPDFYVENENPWQYDDLHVASHTEILKAFSDKLPDRLVVMDLGMGEGHFAEVLFETFGDRIQHYFGIEIAQAGIDRARKRLARFENKKCNRITLINCDYETSCSLPSMKDITGEVNLFIAIESLYYCSGCTYALNAIDPIIRPGSFFINADSLGLYICREHLHKKLGWDLIDRHSVWMFIDEHGRNRKLHAFLDRKPG